MRSVGVVLDPEVLGQHLGFEKGLEGLDVEQLVTQLALKDSMNGFSPWTPRLDVDAARLREPAPVPQREVWCPSLGADEALEHDDGVVGGDGAVHFDGQCLLGELVGDVEQLEGLEVGVWSKQKSMAQTWPGCVARSRVPSVTEVPTLERFLAFLRTRSPSSRHSRWILLWFTQ